MTLRNSPVRNPIRLALACLLATAFGLSVPLIAQPVDEAPAAVEPPPADAEPSVTSLNIWDAFFVPTGSDVIGLAIIWTLIFFSAASIAYALQLALRYRKAVLIPERFTEEVGSLLAQQRYREAIERSQAERSYVGRVTAGALAEAPNGYWAMERAVEESGDAEATRMLRPVEYLNVLGNVAPMMGLFGTVYGMILAFQQLASSGGSPDPGELAGGISTALVTTFWGLIVAIPALSAYALIRNRVDAFCAEGLLRAESLIAPFKPGQRKSGAGGSGRQTGGPRTDDPTDS
ncbi:MAG: MotA/TolQ/ExbB proton channel family protein [Planctomycetota bacterium]